MITTLAKSIREYKKHSILTPVFVTIEVLLEVMIPFLIAYLIDFGIDSGNMTVILRLGGLLLIAAFFSLIFGALSGRSSAISSAGFAKNLREDMFYNIQTFSFSNIDKFSSSSLITRLTTDVTNVQNSYQLILRMAVRSPVMLVFALVAAFTINKSLSLIFLGALPVLGIGLFFIIKYAHPIFREVFKIYDKLNNVVQENLRGIRVVKAFVREDYETEKFSSISKEIYDKFSLAEKILAFNMPLIQFCMYASMILLSWFGARAIVASGNNPAIGFSTGQLMSLMTYTMQILMSLMMLSMVVVMVSISRASAERIVEVLDEDTDLKNKENPIKEIKDGSIEFENVSFSYVGKSDKMALKNINLKINSGETVGIIGGTGSSKTTLVQLIPRLYDVTDGSVKIAGIDVKDYDLKTLRDQVSVVLQKNILFSGTIKENLRWGDQNATDEDIKNAAMLSQANDFIETFSDKYDSHIEQGGSNVSGGQKQRLSIARALLKNPKILILDDSTSAVDTKTDSLIRNALMNDIPHTTKIIIAQRISSIKHADKIIVMDEGSINGLGTHDELLKSNEIYKEVYESQMKGEMINV
ncbi:ATP-binding cassette subfamily B protein [Acetoanaerobium pronyense]|uniref:ATP-binding cassette subfamily B protein n=1 Tax=Acetoanaerobium pronyense TaxID=1482736 RepID=A0ABS4KIP2_9FIRM|nr:ABC transporter ATP-binding protein [Acetoanaerobium pronyense]MBP2026494.1 ATP-binding cassette subfamily B protein [Acetoanaerobium pronyense]